MKLLIRLFYSFFSIISVLCISGFLFGNGGLIQYKELQLYKNELIQNIELLENRKAVLQRNLSSVQSNGDYLVLSAREIGYFKKNQGVIRFGYPLGNIENNDYGHVIHSPALSLVDSDRKNLYALFLGLLTFILLTLFYRYRNDNQQKQF